MLTTRCPNCSTMFRIRPEQLTVRGGRVRCGQCQQAFSALNYLEEVDDGMVLPSNPVLPAKSSPTAAPRPAQTSASSSRQARTVLPPPVAPMNASRGFAADLLPSASVPIVTKAADPVSKPVTDSPPAVTSVPTSLGMSSVEKVNVAADLVLKGSSPAEVRAEAMPDLKFDIDVSGLVNDADGQSAEHVEPFIQGAGELAANAPAVASSKAPAAKSEVAVAPAKPYESKIAKELGVKAYDPERGSGLSQTLMLEEPVELTQMDLGEPDRSARREAGDERADGAFVEDRRNGRGAWKWALGASALCLLALAQGVYVFRTEIARELPQLRQPLEQACAQLGCTVPYPREASDEKIKIESSEFFADGGGAGRYRLVATIANHVPYAQAWPSLELTITDRFDIAIARRVIPPEEWLPAAQRHEPAFEPHSEVAANIALDLGGMAASGYRLYVFYP